MTEKDLKAFFKMFYASVAITAIGFIGMQLTGIYCFVPLAAIGMCLSFPTGIWAFFGLFFIGGKD